MLKVIQKLHNLECELNKEGIRSEDYAELRKEQDDIFLGLGKEVFSYLEPFIIHQKGD